jgi:ribonuclease P protein component
VLAAEHRLRESEAFRRTVRTGRRAGGPALVAHLATAPPVQTAHHSDSTDPGASAPRVGFVVSKAVGGAVVRNQVKRRLRHSVRAHLDLLPPGSELVVRALPAAASLSYAELDAALVRCLDRALTTGARAGTAGRART